MTELGNALEFDNIITDLNNLSLFDETAPESRVKSSIINVHNSMDAKINLILVHYYFGNSKEKVNDFWINILNTMIFSKKLDLLKKLIKVDNKIIKILENFNIIRNELAHYPHRLHKRKSDHLKYKNKHIFKGLEGLKSLTHDLKFVSSELFNILEKRKGRLK